MPLPELNNRINWIDNLRVVAITFVIGIHVTAYGVVNEVNKVGATNNWWVCNFYESAFRCCVPFFLMLTGALLLPQELPLTAFLKKRLNRILWPAIFWGCVYVAYNFGIKHKNEGQEAFGNIGPWLSTQLLDGPIYSYWYIYVLIGLYLIIPILQPWIQKASNRALQYFLIIWVITLALNQFKAVPASSPIELRYFSGYVGFLILGHYLANRVIITKALKYLAVALILTGFFITFTGTYLLSHKAGTFTASLYEYLTLNVVLLSAGGFIYIKGAFTGTPPDTLLNVRNFMTRYGFSIYLIHPLPLMFMVHFNLNYNLVTPLIGIPLTTIICLLITCFIAWAVSKLPYGRYITG
ncbi:acyltransferase family protein [Mucilaginibacter sp. PAMB04274]|uniref:acyltransferase n=1 Tax=Mucilaginibacter sp. PAMB04274 TaxID=3138568 RepID=UPI0031F6C286